MRLALLTGAAVAFSLVGAAGAQAEMIYTTEPTVVETAPAYGYYNRGYDYTYEAPAPVVAAPPGYVYSQPHNYVVVEQPAPTYVQPAPRYVPVPRRPLVVNRPVAEDELVTTGYSSGGCYVDLAGVERCF